MRLNITIWKVKSAYIIVHPVLLVVLWHRPRSSGVSNRLNGSTTRRGGRSGGLLVTFTNEDEAEDEAGDEAGEDSEHRFPTPAVDTCMHSGITYCLEITLSFWYNGQTSAQ